MIKEVFKKQVVITEVGDDYLHWETRLAAHGDSIKDGAIQSVLLSDTAYLFKQTDKIYFMPGCTVPRFKVKQLCEVTGMSISKTPQNASVIIFSNETEKEVAQKDFEYNCIHSKDLEEAIGLLYQKRHVDYKAVPQIAELIDFLRDENNLDYVYVESWSSKNQIETALKGTGRKFFRTSTWITEESAINNFDSILELNKTLVHQKDLLTIINMNNVMTEDMFNETSKMFDSQDKNNHVLALELMANVDYERSALYLFMLFKDHHYAIWDRPETKHVNFKSMMDFFNLRRGFRLSDMEDVIGELEARDLLTTEHLDYVEKLSKEDFESSLGNEYFSVTQVSRSPKLLLAAAKGDRKFDPTLPPIPDELLNSIPKEDDEKDDDYDDEEEDVLTETEDDEN